jgi:hypothetical protein
MSRAAPIFCRALLQHFVPINVMPMSPKHASVRVFVIVTQIEVRLVE